MTGSTEAGDMTDVPDAAGAEGVADVGEPTMPPMTSFRIGTGIGLVAPTTLALLEPTNGRLGEQLWSLVDRGADVDDLLDALSSSGLRSLGSFAMAQFESHQVRIVVRGTAVADLDVDGRTTVVTADGVRTWHEEVIPGAGDVVLRLGAPMAGHLPFRLAGGLVPADLLCRASRAVLNHGHVSLDEIDFEPVRALDPERIASSAAAVEVEVEVPGPAHATPPVLVGSTESIEPEPPLRWADAEPSSEPEQAVQHTPNEPESVDPDRTIAARDFDEQRSSAPATEPSAPTPIVTSQSSAADDYDFDEIFGRTVARSVQGAAVIPPAVDVPEVEPAPSAPPTFAVAPPPNRSDTGVPIIQGIPPITGAPPALGDHDGRTISKAQLQAMRAAQAHAPIGSATGAAQPSMGGPSVQAVLCVNQHGNPPHLSVCRHCSAPLVGLPTMIARPVLGMLQITGGQRIAMDKPVLIGRNPKLEGRMPAEMPQLLKLDVGQGLSRTHAIIRVEGWQVLLEDLNSANGTIVTLPGQAARRLHAGEPSLLEHGTSIDFGGEVSATYVAP